MEYYMIPRHIIFVKKGKLTLNYLNQRYLTSNDVKLILACFGGEIG